MNAEQVARYMPTVAELLLGQPNQQLSTDGEWRYGRQGSLSVSIEAGTWYDHEHSEGGGVLDLIGREYRCDRAEAMAWLKANVDDAADQPVRPNGAGHKPKLGKLGEMVATYDYLSEHGELVLQVCRFQPKTFRQRRPDPSARSGWSWKVKGSVEPVPYRLPDLLKAKAVVVVEGEKDADRLATLGFTATTNPGGVEKWPTSFAPWFAGKVVAIIPDNDAAGEKHAQTVARVLLGHASRITLLPLPGLPPKGDVSDWIDAGGTADALRALIKAAPPWQPAAQDKDVADDRPVVRVALGELHHAVADANRILAERSAGLFIFGNALVSIEPVDGAVQTIAATPIRIGLELARTARFERVVRVTDTGPEWRQCDPPLRLPAAIADEPGGWRSPVLTGLTEVPILRPDGSVVNTSGYDPTSRLYLWGGPFAPVPGDPEAALALLLDAIHEFPFVEAHHRAVALALLLTAVVRRTLPSAPMFGISAREAGTGKGLLAQLAAIMATGRKAAEMPWPSSSDDQRKLILAALQTGRPLLLLDNLTQTLESEPLCIMLTSENYSDRILGFSKMPIVPANILAIATGNNLRVAGDMVRRMVPIEMDAQVEHPELRRFERELVPWAIANRQKLVAAAIGILAAYHRAGSPLPDGFTPLGSFETWSCAICGALIWLGQPDPREALTANRAADPKRLLLSRMLSGMQARFGTSWQGAGSIHDIAKAQGPGDDLRDGVDEITVRARDDRGARITLGRWLEAEKGRVVAGLRLEGERDAHSKANVWRAGKVCG